MQRCLLSHENIGSITTLIQSLFSSFGSPSPSLSRPINTVCAFQTQSEIKVGSRLQQKKRDLGKSRWGQNDSTSGHWVIPWAPVQVEEKCLPQQAKIRNITDHRHQEPNNLFFLTLSERIFHFSAQPGPLVEVEELPDQHTWEPGLANSSGRRKHSWSPCFIEFIFLVRHLFHCKWPGQFYIMILTHDPFL